MGFFSGLGDIVGDVVGAVTSPVASLIGTGLSFLGGQQTNEENRGNSREQMIFQKHANQHAMNFNAEQAELNRRAARHANQHSMNFSASQAQNAMDFSAAQAQKAMDFSGGQAQKAMDFGERMSSTAYQRAVTDLKAAGLNPMLAYTQGGSSTPGAAAPQGVSSSGVAGSGASGTGSSGSGGVSSAGSMSVSRNPIEAVNAAAAIARNVADVQNVLATNELIKAQTRNVGADTMAKGSASYRDTTQGHVNQQTEERLRRSTGPIVDQIKASTAQSDASAEQIRSQNLAIKALMENPQTKDLAPFLQLIMSR